MLGRQTTHESSSSKNEGTPHVFPSFSLSLSRVLRFHIPLRAAKRKTNGLPAPRIFTYPFRPTAEDLPFQSLLSLRC